VAGPGFVCQGCRGVACPVDGRPVARVDVDGARLGVGAAFCCLGDMFSAGGGCGRAVAARCCAAWGGFRGLLPILTSGRISFRTRGGVFAACVRSAVLRGGGAWAPGASGLRRLRGGGRAVVGWVCGAGLGVGFPRLCFAGGWVWAGSRLFFALGVLGGAGACSVPLPASAPSCDWGFRAPEIVGGQGRRGPHVWQMM